jgi:tetratricopeptide (TPR) repeat protein
MSAISARSAFTAALIVLVALWIGPFAAASITGSACDTPQHALESGDFTHADKLYAGLAATQACARQGLIAVDALSAAQQLLSAGLTSQADAEIVRALDAVPLLTLPGTVLPATGQRGVTLAEILNADGFHQQAVQLLQQVIESDPSITLDRTAQGILGLIVPPWYTRAGHGLLRVWHFITSPVPGSVLSAVVLVVVVGLWPRMRRRLHLQPFAFGSTAVPGADPDELRARVWDEMHRLASDYARTADDRALRLDIAGPYEDQLDLIGAATDPLGPVGTAISAIARSLLKRIRGRCRLVTGVLQPKVSLRLSITTVDGVMDAGGSTVIRHEDLGLPEPDPADDPVGGRFGQLAMPAAAWIILTHYDSYTLGGTRKWPSFVHFVAGCAWLKAGNLTRAEECFDAACDIDPQNIAAAFNLGALLVQTSADGQKVRRGHDLLRFVLDSTEDKTGDLQWYRSRYVLLLTTLDSGGPGGSGRDSSAVANDQQRAIDLATELIYRDGAAGDVPQEFVDNSLGAVLALAARELVQTTSDLREVSTDGASAPADGDQSLLGLLANRERKGTSEKLFEYAWRYCARTPQLKYNAYRYQEKRAVICQQAIAECEAELTGGSIDEQRRQQLEAQRRDLGAVRAAALSQMLEFRHDIEEVDDPILNAAIKPEPAGSTRPDDAHRAGDQPMDPQPHPEGPEPPAAPGPSGAGSGGNATAPNGSEPADPDGSARAQLLASPSSNSLSGRETPGALPRAQRPYQEIPGSDALNLPTRSGSASPATYTDGHGMPHQ